MSWFDHTFFKARQNSGHGKQQPVTARRVIAAGIASFIGIGAISILVDLLPKMELLLIGSFGASAVLLYGAPRAPFSQPRNLIGGHFISAVIGLLCFKLLPDISGLQEAAAVSLAIMVMLITRTVHPPGGATALIAVIGSEHLHSLGWSYLFVVMAGALIMLLVALVVNNLFSPGIYPERWD